MKLITTILLIVITGVCFGQANKLKVDSTFIYYGPLVTMSKDSIVTDTIKVLMLMVAPPDMFYSTSCATIVYGWIITQRHYFDRWYSLSTDPVLSTSRYLQSDKKTPIDADRVWMSKVVNK